MSDAAGDVQDQVDEMNAQGFLGIRSDQYSDDCYTLTTYDGMVPPPHDDRTPVWQPPAQDGAPPPEVPT